MNIGKCKTCGGWFNPFQVEFKFKDKRVGMLKLFGTCEDCFYSDVLWESIRDSRYNLYTCEIGEDNDKAG